MNKLLSTAIATTLAATSFTVFAMNDNTKMDMKKVDANGDGMISKAEFTKYHEAMWAKMKKDKRGMVDAKDMEMMHDNMMSSGSMKDDSMMKGGDKMTKGGMEADKAKGK